MNTIKKIDYDKTYSYVISEQNVEGNFFFLKNKEGHTYMGFNFKTPHETAAKQILLTKEEEVDEFDIEAVNEILAQNKIEITNIL